MIEDKPMSVEEAAERGLTSMDIAEEKREQLKALFPEAFNEDKVDFEQLRRALGDWVDPGKERYGLNWPGKADCMKVIQAPSVATLKPDRDESVDFDNTENLFIEGDNLEVLKLLQKSYFGKIKMIYIDPPYNTGKEFIYPDKYQENLDTYLAYTGQVDDEGKKFATNTDSSGRYHANWLNMMYPRLYLARNLLREDGVIFISIGEDEQVNLRQLGNLIFGEDNFVSCLVWKRRSTPPNDQVIGVNHEYILVFARNIEALQLHLQPRSPDALKAYVNPDEDPRGPYRVSDLSGSNKGGRGADSCVYPITSPDGATHMPPRNKRWLYNQEKMAEYIRSGRVGFRKGSGTPFLKRYLSEVRDGVTLPTILPDVATSLDSSREIRDLFSDDVFDFPKPLRLMELVSVCGMGASDIVLDFFAGSGTLQHAVMNLNARDGGARRCISIQLPEALTDTAKEHAVANAFCQENDLECNIAALAKERIRRAAKKIAEESDGRFAFETKDKLDLGFRVFKLNRSNFRIWDGDLESIEELEKQLEMHVDHIDGESSAEDILYELLLKSGFELTTKVEKLTMAGKDVYAIAEGTLLICLDKNITAELIDEMAAADPIQVICLDEGFQGNDQLKTNAVQTFKARAGEDEDAVVFRTV